MLLDTRRFARPATTSERPRASVWTLHFGRERQCRGPQITGVESEHAAGRDGSRRPRRSRRLGELPELMSDLGKLRGPDRNVERRARNGDRTPCQVDTEAVVK